jgi:hypothetical protein
VVKRWKEAIESKKTKRKREDGDDNAVKKEEGASVKRVKEEGGEFRPSTEHMALFHAD